MGTKTDYERPREKVQRLGVEALSDVELLQLLIGSGTAKASVSRIARKALKLIKRAGHRVTLQQLRQIEGLGVARATQFLATFELARRYPVGVLAPLVTSASDVLQLVASVSPLIGQFWFITLDGARRLIEKRSFAFTDEKLTLILREMSSYTIRDQAVHVVIARQINERLLVPTMADLNLARDARQMARLLNIESIEYILCNDNDHHAVLKGTP